MQPVVYAKATNGQPTSDPLADLSGVAADTSFTWAAQWGCLNATVSWDGTLQEGFSAASSWLGNPITIFAPDGDSVWSGLVWEVEFGAGARKRTRSLDGFANRTRIVYDEIDASTNPPTVTTADKRRVADDTTLQSIYGICEDVYKPSRLTSSSGTGLVTKRLAERKRLLWTPEGGRIGDVSADAPSIELRCQGWWRVLGNLSYSAATTGEADVGQVIKDVLTAYIAANGMLVGDYGDVSTSTGVTAARQYDDYPLASDLIKKLIALAPSYTFWIDATRVPHLTLNARTSSTVSYVETAAGELESSAGAVVQPWDVRPLTRLRQADFVPVQSAASAADNIETIYLVETTYSTSSGLSYKTAVPGLDGTLEP
jgi:hypothetical protein